ncbi:MAG: sterol desaturase family protein [Chitinophagales bacterium]|nr:sterol desaturase family protein [Chitinophagales bacterium]
MSERVRHDSRILTFDCAMFEKDPLLFASPFFAILIAIEVIINTRQHLHLYLTKDSVASISMGAVTLVIGLGVKIAAFFVFTFLHQFAFLELGNVWWVWVLCMFGDDFSFYWHHRLSHEVRILWAAHVNHHSSEMLNFSTALRQSWTEQLYKYVFWLWMPLVGFDPIMIMTMMSINLIFQFLPHTQLVGKLGPLEWIFNTPSHHRVHHASNHKYLDRNHAGLFIIWDRMFGTFQEEDEKEKPVYGITNNIHTYNLFQIASHEFKDLCTDIKRASDFKTKLKYIFYPPGWSHDGEDRRAKVLRGKV